MVPHLDEIKKLKCFLSNVEDIWRLKKVDFFQECNVPTLSVDSDEFLHYRGLVFNGIL